VFSDGFSEGQTRDIDEEFPSDSHPYTEYYDYLSDSDLEDESSYSEEEYPEAAESDNSEMPPSPHDPGSQVLSTVPPEHPPQPSPDAGEVRKE